MIKHYKFAIILFNYFPYGGLQRDFYRIARRLTDLGHQVDILTMDWQGEQLNDVRLYLFERSKGSAVTRNNRFFKAIKKHLSHHQYDCVLGFNKMPYLDAYFVADTCYIDKALYERSVYYRLTRRFWHFYRAEQSVFKNGQALLLHISPMQKLIYEGHYPLAKNNAYLLGANVDKRLYANPIIGAEREVLRFDYQISSEQIILLLVGSSFKTKGLERAIQSLASLDKAQLAKTELWVVGNDKQARYLKLAETLGCASQIRFLGARDDVPKLMAIADLLVHPAYVENTGTVLVEALASGLPVLTTSNCGYAYHIEKAIAGKVIRTTVMDTGNNEIIQENLNLVLQQLLTSDLQSLRQNALNYGQQTNLSAQTDDAVEAVLNHLTDNQDAIYFRHLDFNQLLAADGEIFRHKKNRLTKRLVGKTQNFIIKLHDRMGMSEFIHTLLKGKRPVTDAYPEKQAIDTLSAMAIRVPKCLGYHREGWGMNKRSYILLEDFGDRVTLEDWVNASLQNNKAYSQNERLTMIKKVAEITKKLHDNNWVHRDLYLCHFFILDEGELALIDLHRCQKVSIKTKEKMLIKDLGALFFSTEETLTKIEQLQFIKHYTNKPLHQVLTENKDFWDKVLMRKNQLRNRNKRG